MPEILMTGTSNLKSIKPQFSMGEGGYCITLVPTNVFSPIQWPLWGHLSHTDTFLVLLSGTRVNS